MNITAVDRHGVPHQLAAAPGTVLMELLRDAGLGVEAVCGGCCSCATCHVHLEPSRAGPRGDVEAALLATSTHFDSARSRLSCQIELDEQHDGLQLVVAPEE